ncbi:MAG: type II toxin-antitoxin system PrlF family antitoxin [Beijerinckiaceae bacterium]
MPRTEFKGSITTTGRSEALRLDKALFKAHPEFRQRARIKASVMGPGCLLVTLDPEAVEEADAEADPVVRAYLAFLERDMRDHPDRLQPITESLVERVTRLTNGVEVSPDDILPDDVTL